ncbi:MAG: hypothetical protein EF813_11185 [Methanosarcinales archaeon]|nr:MAG: hypothetical protein EF813_11185 [Methanosarcinales archaeon]
MEAAPYPLQIPKNIMTLVNLRTEEEHVDESTALTQLLFMGAQDYVVELYDKGRISLGRAADMLGVSTFDIIAIARERGIQIGATEEQQKKSRETATSLVI